MTRTEEGRPPARETGRAARSEHQGSGLPCIVPRPTDTAEQRRACRRTEAHLRRRGLWGELSRRVLDEIAGWSR